MTQQFQYLPTPEARKLAQELAALRSEVDTIQGGLRATQLQNATLHNGWIVVRDADGVIRQVIGRQDDGTYGQQHINGPPPSRPNTPEVVPIMAGLEVRWNGALVDAMPRDFSHILVYVSDAGESFIAGPSNLAGYLFRAGSTIVAPLPYTEHWVRFVAVNTSGEESEESLTASGIPTRILGTDLFPEIITETEIADDSISTPKLKANAVTALNIAAEAIQAGHIEAGAVTASKLAATIVLTSRLEMYDASSNLTVLLDGATGDAVLTGELRTALTGRRWVINPGNATFQNSIQAHIDGSTDWMDLSCDIVNSNPSIAMFTNSASGIPDTGGWVVNKDQSAVTWFTTGGSATPHYLRTTASMAQVVSPIVQLRAAGTPAPASGVRRVELVASNSSDVSLGNSILYYRPSANDRPEWHCPASNIGLLFGLDRMYVQNGAGAHGPLTVSSLTQSSAQASKRNIRDVGYSALAAVRAAPAKAWEYEPSPGAGETVVRSPDAADPTVVRETRIPARPAPEPRTRLGPMAETLPPELVEYDPDRPDVPLVDHGSWLGLLHKAIEEIGARLDGIEARLPRSPA